MAEVAEPSVHQKKVQFNADSPSCDGVKAREAEEEKASKDVEDALPIPVPTPSPSNVSPSPAPPIEQWSPEDRTLLGRKRNSEWVFKPLKLKFKVKELEELYRNYVYRQQQNLLFTACLILVALSVMVILAFLINAKVRKEGGSGGSDAREGGLEWTALWVGEEEERGEGGGGVGGESVQ